MKKHLLVSSFIEKSASAIPLVLVQEKDYPEWFINQNEVTQRWLTNNNFTAKKGMVLSVPGEQGDVAQVVIGLMDENDTAALARAARVLPFGEYQLREFSFYSHYACIKSPLFYLGWGLEQYRFLSYKPSAAELFSIKSLVIPQHQDFHLLQKLLKAVCQTRDLINTPAQDLNPDTLEAFVCELAQQHNADFRSIVGDELLQQNFPSIHMVGRASSFKPRLLELNWGDASSPKVTLVGKGVCFDTGGLDLKSAAGMLIMKKDMSGAAQVLGLASLIMENQLPVRLQVLIPAVENSIAANAYRPGDIVTTRKGLSVVIDNTDAEGRVVLSDALTYAMESPPEILIDIASLTGASSVSFGYDIASFFTNNNQFAANLLDASEQVNEPLWRMPLYTPYKDMISPEVADLTNASPFPYAGSITAALFLQEFATKADHPQTTWVHFDTAAWNDKAKPGKPIGGEATVIRSLYHYLAKRFSAL